MPPPLLQTLAVSGGASFLLAKYAPQYSLGLVTTTVLLFFTYIALYSFYAIILYPRFTSPLRHIPGPSGGSFLWGQTNEILKAPSGWPMRDWAETVPNNGLLRYSMWFQERILVTTPAALSEVLVTKNYDFIKPPQVRQGLGRILGIGVLLAEGEEHKVQRKNLMPAFAFRHVKDIYPIFWKKSQEMVKCLGEALESGDQTQSSATDEDVQHETGAINVGTWTSRATLDIIGLSGMGQDFDSLHDPTNDLNNTYRNVFNPGRAGRILQLLGALLPFWLVANLPLKRNREIIAAQNHIKNVCRDLIAKKHKAMEAGKRTEVDILSVAIESGGFKDEELVNQMMTFLVAGHETTATAMVWALYQLCLSPEVQDKLREEIRHKIPSLDSSITAAQIDDCHYLQAVCNEILRLWAPVGLTLRVADVNTSLAGEFVPKGTLIIISPRAINTSTALWGADALEFKPERWLNADGKANAKGGAESNYAMLTFLHGPRSCIGQKFAQAEFACLLAAWVGRFRSRFEEGSKFAEGELDIKGGITSKPKGGVWVKLEEVEGW